jgi:dethiobiotin synthetase
MKNGFVITGIHTNIGKTLVSAVLLAGLEYDYWKPIQTGTATALSDTQWLQNIFQNKICFHPERYILPLPASPNIAANEQNLNISLHDFTLPQTTNGILIEGAGGLLVPLNNHHLMIDLFQKFNLPIILVSNLYLGAINHTLLSVEALQTKKIPIHGIIFNQTEDFKAMKTIEHFSGIKNLGFIPELKTFDYQTFKLAFHKYLLM